VFIDVVNLARAR